MQVSKHSRYSAFNIIFKSLEKKKGNSKVFSFLFDVKSLHKFVLGTKAIIELHIK